MLGVFPFHLAKKSVSGRADTAVACRCPCRMAESIYWTSDIEAFHSVHVLHVSTKGNGVDKTHVVLMQSNSYAGT